MPNCIITKVLTKKLWHSSGYKGDDGQIVTAEGFFIEVSAASKKGSEAICNAQDVRDHLDKVLKNITGRLNQQMSESGAAK